MFFAGCPCVFPSVCWRGTQSQKRMKVTTIKYNSICLALNYSASVVQGHHTQRRSIRGKTCRAPNTATLQKIAPFVRKAPLSRSISYASFG